MTTEAFKPYANTSALDVTAAAQTITPAIPSPSQAQSEMQYLITVAGTQTVFIAFNQAAVIPTTGTNNTGIPILAGQTVMFSVPSGSTVSAIASGVGSSIYVTPGKGV